MVYLVKFIDTYEFRLLHSEQLTSWDVITEFVNKMRNRSVVVGWMHTAGGWQLTAEATNNEISLYAILDVAVYHFNYEGCLGGACAHGVFRLPPLSPGAIGNVVIYWNQADLTNYHCILW